MDSRGVCFTGVKDRFDLDVFGGAELSFFGFASGGAVAGTFGAVGEFSAGGYGGVGG